jgi:hypothetical protein
VQLHVEEDLLARAGQILGEGQTAVEDELIANL